MFISTAAAHSATSGGTADGGATALSIILAVGLMLFLAYTGHKRWRKRQLERGG